MKSKNFEAETFVDNLIRNGAYVSCDSTNKKFNAYTLPHDFDELKFKRGQTFYNNNIFCLFYGKLMGLITILAVPSILNILLSTNMSGTAYKAYKRYMATIFHMTVWYNEDFHPGSKLWKSMEEVRRLHNVASKRSACVGSSRITQMDMALTQFGFMGFALTQPSRIGLHNANPIDIASWVYLWRIVGGLMGIEDEFNICRDSLEETTAICVLLHERHFRPLVERGDPDFVRMARTLMDGMWVMQPTFDANLAYAQVLRCVAPEGDAFAREYATLSGKQKWWLNFGTSVLHNYRYRIFKWYHNTTIHVSLWLMRHFPFLAIWRHGRRDAYVHILQTPSSSSWSSRDLYQSG